jgi:hypothetical protein
MLTRCERQGQVEVGVVTHGGREFRALGAIVVGPHVTGYTRLATGVMSLTTWCGRTMLACRSEVVEEYHDGSMAMLFRLSRSRMIVGYALGESGMLFRGVLVRGCSDDESRRTARRIADDMAELDAEAEAAFDFGQQEEPMLAISYRCPECRHDWQERWTSDCDSECPNCHTGNVSARGWRDCEGEEVR